MAKYELRLYLTGETREGKKALKRLKKVLEKQVEGEYNLEVIDIKKHPKLAEEEKILATPTVEKHLPLPVKRIIGKLDKKEEILFGLDLVPEEESLEKEDE